MIKVTELAKRFGDVEAVAGIDFDVREGELFGFLGPNGAASACLPSACATSAASGSVELPFAMTALFDAIASDYDAWYDEPAGRAILAAELACLRRLVGTCPGRWLEVGVGSGRFAAGLGIGEGIDPSAHMLQIAARRGVRTYLGTADSLPFPDGHLNGVLLALTLCFIAEPATALRECRRVLTGDGLLLVGIVPADSPWGLLYARKKATGHRIYPNFPGKN